MITQSTHITKTTREFGQNKFIEPRWTADRWLDNKPRRQSAQTGVMKLVVSWKKNNNNNNIYIAIY